MNFIYDILDIAIYACIGTILMLVGNFLIDLMIPCHFPTEIQKGNKAVGWLSAGSFIGIGIILKAAISSPSAEVVQESLAEGIAGSVIYSITGIIFFILGYFVVNLFNRKYNLNEEIGKGNAAAGIMVFGIFVGLAIVISGVIL